MIENKSWDYYLSHIDQQDEIEETEKQELFQKWGYLREVLGETWFVKEESKLHPLHGYFYNAAPWCLRWIGELGESIKYLQEKENFDDILKRLISNYTFEEAYCELRVGYSLFKLGVPFEFLRPLKKKKTPDIVMNIGERKIFVEITKKNSPEDPLHSSQNYNEISWFLLDKIPSNFSYNFDILKPLSTPRTNQIIKICEDMIDKAKKSGFEEFHIPNIIDLYIYEREYIDRVPTEKQVMRGRTPDFDELSRIRGTIKTKEIQLRSEQPNVLLIFDSLLWPLENKELFYSKLVDTLEETVYQFTNLSAVIIYIETYFMDDEPIIKSERNYIAIQGYDEELLRSKNKVIIINEFAVHPLLQNEIEILKNI